MASYVSPNFNPAYYQVPTFEANDEFVFSMAKQKQAQFNEGLKQVGQQYNFHLNLDLTSKEGIAKKEAYMEEAKKKLSSIATADFSLQENVNVANSIYKPLVNDEFIKTDLIVTKNKKNGLATYMNDANSKDEKIRNTANIYSYRNMLREASLLENAKSVEEMKNLDFNYVRKPETDFTSRVSKFLESAKVGDKGLNIEQEMGKWLMTEKNGPQAVPALTALAQSIATPEDLAYLESYVKYTYNTEKDKVVGQGITTAEQYDKNLATNILNGTAKMIESSIKGEETLQSKIKEKIKEGNPETHPLPTDSPETVEAKRQQFEYYEQKLKESKAKVLEQRQTLRKYSLPENATEQERKDFNQRLATIAANPFPHLAQQELFNQARSFAAGYANATYSVSLKENPYILKGVELQNSIILERIKGEENRKTKTLEQEFKGTDNQGNNKEPGEKGKKTEAQLISVTTDVKQVLEESVFDIVQKKKREIADGATGATESALTYLFEGINKLGITGAEGTNIGVAQKSINNLLEDINKGYGNFAFSTGSKRPISQEDLKNIETFLGKPFEPGKVYSRSEMLEMILEKANDYKKSIFETNTIDGAQLSSAIEGKMLERKANLSRLAEINEKEQEVLSKNLDAVYKKDEKDLTTDEKFLKYYFTKGEKGYELQPFENVADKLFDTYMQYPANQLVNVQNVKNIPPEMLVTKNGKPFVTYENYKKLYVSNPENFENSPLDTIFYQAKNKYEELTSNIKKDASKQLGTAYITDAQTSQRRKLFPELTYDAAKSGTVGIQQQKAIITSGSIQSTSFDNRGSDIGDIVAINATENVDDITLKLNNVDKKEIDSFTNSLKILNKTVLTDGLSMDKAFVVEITPENEITRKPSYNVKFADELINKVLKSMDEKSEEYKLIDQKIRREGITISKTGIDNKIESQISYMSSPYAYMVDKSENKYTTLTELADGYKIDMWMVNQNPPRYNIKVFAGKDDKGNPITRVLTQTDAESTTGFVNKAFSELSKYYVSRPTSPASVKPMTWEEYNAKNPR